jgi:hypothetical protein
MNLLQPSPRRRHPLLVATKLYLRSYKSHIMQRPSLAHFSRQLSLRYVDLPLSRARHLSSLSGRYQSKRYTVATGSFEKEKKMMDRNKTNKDFFHKKK